MNIPSLKLKLSLLVIGTALSFTLVNCKSKKDDPAPVVDEPVEEAGPTPVKEEPLAFPGGRGLWQGCNRRTWWKGAKGNEPE